MLRIACSCGIKLTVTDFEVPHVDELWTELMVREQGRRQEGEVINPVHDFGVIA